MLKFHISKNGEPALCSATIQSCPLGGSDEHFASKEAAYQHLEEKAAKENNVFSIHKKMTPVVRVTSRNDNVVKINNTLIHVKNTNVGKHFNAYSKVTETVGNSDSKNADWFYESVPMTAYKRIPAANEKVNAIGTKNSFFKTFA